MMKGNGELNKLIDNGLTGELKPKVSNTDPNLPNTGTKIYTRADVINAIAIYHLTRSFAETSRRTGVSQPVLVKWINKATNTQLLDEIKQYAEEWKMQTQNDLRVLASAALSQAYKTIDEASPLQAAQIAQIAMEQVRKIDGNAEQMTQNNFFFTNNTLKGYDDAQKVALMERVAARHKAEAEEVQTVSEGE